MNFKVSSKDLLFHIQKASGAISSKPVMSVLENFKFTINDGMLQIVGTDVENTIITNLLVDADEDFGFTIPAHIILDTLKALPSQPISVEYDEESKNIDITAATGDYHLIGQPLDEFPEIKSKISDEFITMNSDDIKEAISKTIFATSNDDVRMAMQGIYVEIDYNHVNFVATDAHKLVKYTNNTVKSDFTTSFILPKKSASLIRNSLQNDVEVKIYTTKTNVYFVTEETEIIGRLIDSNYPNYNVVIPTNNEIEIIVDRLELLNSLRRIIIYANKTTTGVKLDITESGIELKAEDLDFYNKAAENIKANYSGEDLKIGFSAKFLIEMLSALESDEVKLLVSSPTRPSLLVPVTEDDSADVLMLLMPLVIQNM